MKHGALFIIDVEANMSGNTVTDLKLVPMFVNRLGLNRLHEHSLVWDANMRLMHLDGSGAVTRFCKFVNSMSAKDGGKGAVKLRVVEDQSVPGAPVLSV